MLNKILILIIGLLLSFELAAQAPEDVEVTVYLIDIEEIDSRTQSFTANLFVSLRWLDPALAHEGPGSIGVPLDDIWNYNLQILNQQRLVKTFIDSANITPEGLVTVRQRYWGGFSQPLDLQDFPFDSQRLQINLVRSGVVGSTPNFIISPDSGLANHMKIPDWQVLDWKVVPENIPIGRDGRTVPSVVLTVDVKRSISFFTLKVILPLMLIVAMSWLVFWIGPDLMASKISVGVTTMLTLIAYRFAIGGMVPRLSFLTGLDYFVLGSSILVFLTLMVVAFTAYLIEKGRLEQARRLDRISRWMAPLLFLAMILQTLWLQWGQN
jgi:hypothetical protein